MRRVVIGYVLAVLCGIAAPSFAQWPFMTEEASNLPEGRVEVSAGVGYRERDRETRFYNDGLLSPPQGRYWATPTLEASVGIGSRAELSAQYEYLVYDLDRASGSDTETGDLRLWTKLGLMRLQRQDVSLRLGFKLPNSGEIGSNETDAFVSALYDLRWWQLRFSLNAGIAVLGNPAKDRAQDDMLNWGTAILWQLPSGFRLGLESGGMNGPFGVDRRRDHRTHAAILGWGLGQWRFDAALRYGLHQDEGWGWLAGVTYAN